MRASKRMRKATFHRLAPHGLTPSQGRALDTLAWSGGRGIRLNQLAERLRIAPRSATTVVDALEAAGLVTRSPDPDDRRATLLHLTTQGEEAVDRIATVRREVAAEYFGPVSSAERVTLLRLLRVAEEAYEQAHPHHGPHGRGPHDQHGHHRPHGSPATAAG
ncbi:MarR family transcriptional regulator [Streptacidiphilus pinicola]|uniref:MarR family transcriptional regulator n=1 Tax=Streptacidiphilus pinicola TaxID=2219663 RepID=A0A2X0KI99_9ACTN|nr:MarR family transcriptional regulator [Streptacidiphilus pinicola]